jgi:hypothetical protein
LHRRAPTTASGNGGFWKQRVQTSDIIAQPQQQTTRAAAPRHSQPVTRSHQPARALSAAASMDRLPSLNGDDDDENPETSAQPRPSKLRSSTSGKVLNDVLYKTSDTPPRVSSNTSTASAPSTSSASSTASTTSQAAPSPSTSSGSALHRAATVPHAPAHAKIPRASPDAERVAVFERLLAGALLCWCT